MRKIAQGDVEAIPFPSHLDVASQMRAAERVEEALRPVSDATDTANRIRDGVVGVLDLALRKAFAGAL